MPTKAFEHIHVAVVGKFEDGEKFQGWIRHNGGDYYKKVDSRVTHLIASEDAFRKNVEAVQTAKELGTIHIVNYDWLYDSLQTKPSPRPKKAVAYLWENILEPELRPLKRPRRSSPPQPAPKPKSRIKDPFAKTTPAKRRRTVALPKGNVYVEESTNESWDATLHRPQQDGKREKFRVAIFKSMQKPETYSVYAKYSRVGKSEVTVLAPPKSSLTVAKTKFKELFLLQTGKEWEDRTDSTLPPPKKDDEGNSLPFHEGWYDYQAESVLSVFLKQPGLSERPVASEGDVPRVDKSEDTKSPVNEHVSSADGKAPLEMPASIGEDSGFDADVDSLEMNLAHSFRGSSPVVPLEDFVANGRDHGAEIGDLA
ncbi:hypothetical protein N7478_000930 [Penicillium angulare]|uniref:uncharacterized protein n=1 Tax=Penicillium angulare TaxID=116970 RepID=UPI00254069F3|nr:uncharacterized protein N7478_000930 [Penicillium angulare]KAJ5291679.1 hypothetical protein N7478_000930 [Penicillium angulare]